MNRIRPLTGVILAGGASRRMGGQDKGLIDFRGRPLIAWAIAALAPQVDELLIVANRNLETYRRFGHPLVSDLRPDFPGPLAGFEAALEHARHAHVLFCPTDVPGLPPDYAEKMSRLEGAQASVAEIAGHWQPVLCLLPRTARENLGAVLDGGERKAARWLESLAPKLIALDEDARALRDADTPEDLNALARD